MTNTYYIDNEPVDWMELIDRALRLDPRADVCQTSEAAIILREHGFTVTDKREPK